MRAMQIFREGRLTGLGTAVLGVLGLGMILYTLLLAESFFWGALSFVVGCGLLGFAAQSNNAASLGLTPFAHDPLGWRRAKETYEDASEPHVPKNEK